MFDSIEPVDLAWDGKPAMGDFLHDKYDWFVACHVIEHQTCLISFLQDIEQVTLNGGWLVLAIPNKDLMFD
jgi:2-polyprenyl-3-methyl-5-hydroxy-6-metoxy-1,4-benzoquinol methylase